MSLIHAPRFTDADKKLHNAVQQFDERRVMEALAEGADPNAIMPGNNPNNDSILHEAVKSRSAKLVRHMVLSGAAVDIPDISGNTPLHLASMYEGCEANVRLLLQHGADPNRPNGSGNTPLHLATTGYNEETILALLRAGGDVQRSNNKQENVPEFAAKIGTKAAEALAAAIDRAGEGIRVAPLPTDRLDCGRLFNLQLRSWELTPKNRGFWLKFDVIAEQLAAQGTPLTCHDTWQEMEEGGERIHLLELADSYFQAPQAATVLAEHGLYLTPDDLVSPTGELLIYVENLAGNAALGKLFTEKLWKDTPKGALQNFYTALTNLLPEQTAQQVRHYHQLQLTVTRLQHTRQQGRS